jgi:hypothetical protein
VQRGLSENNPLDLRCVVLAGVVYAALVAIMWAPYNLYSGMGYETAFPYHSSLSSFLEGFLYRSDPLRIHTNTFYHLAYLIGKALGIDGSYVPFQVVYASLWWARGLLVFLILRRFLPASPLICYLAGALVVVHASDGALQWVGQMNQFGFVFWMLLAFYLLLEAFRTDKIVRAGALTLAACFFEYMSLFSYESQLLLLLVFPSTLLVLERRWRKLIFISAAWYSVPACYLVLTRMKYLHSSGDTYQELVLRKSWSAVSLMSDWWLNFAASLAFWKWSRDFSNSQVLLPLVAAAVLVGGGLAAIRLAEEDRRPRLFVETARAWWVLLAAGFVGVILSFPVYLLLDSVRGLWRTQFLSGIGSGLVFTALLGLASYKLRSQTAKAAILLAGGAVIVYFGCQAAIQLGAFHRGIWERHRTVLTEVLRIAPSVKPETVIVLTDVPRDKDPFGDDMWFDLPLRLVYPGIPVDGVYFYTDGAPAPGNVLKAEGDRWRQSGNPVVTPINGVPIAKTLVIKYDPSGNGTLANVLPPFICRQACAAELYNPAAFITAPIAPSAVRRYRLDAR